MSSDSRWHCAVRGVQRDAIGDEMTNTLCSVLVADPPWLFGDALPGKARGAVKHYRCLSTNDIVRFPLPELADDALLFLWRVASMQRSALAVMEAWGFGQPKSEICWVKLKQNADPGSPRIGMGRYVRNAHEVCLIGARGSALRLIEDHGVPSVIQAPRGRHSAKPAAFFEAVERLCPSANKVELFARRQRPGWTCLGDEVAGCDVDPRAIQEVNSR